MEPEPLRGEVLTNDRHLDVARVVTAVLRGQRVTQPPGRIGEATHLAEQLFPIAAGDTAGVEIGARVLASMVEETDVVVGLLQRLDLSFDERVERVERRLDVGRDLEVHIHSNDEIEPASLRHARRASVTPVRSLGGGSACHTTYDVAVW